MVALFVYGSGSNHLVVHLNDQSACAACGRPDTRDAVIDYDYLHIFRVFRNVKSKVVRVVCAACGNAENVESRHEQELYKSLGRNPIPFMDRYGAHVLLLLVVAWFALAYYFPCVVNPASDRCVR